MNIYDPSRYWQLKNRTIYDLLKNRLRLKSKTASTTIMSLKLNDITQWNVSAVVFGSTAVHKMVPVWIFITEKLNYFMTSLRGKNEVQVKFENSMHHYNVTLVHWHHTLGCQCSSFGSYAIHKVVQVRVLIATKLNYFMISLRGKNKVQVKFENSMHNYNVTLVHWYHTLGCQSSSLSCSQSGARQITKMLWTEIVILIVRLVTAPAQMEISLAPIQKNVRSVW